MDWFGLTRLLLLFVWMGWGEGGDRGGDREDQGRGPTFGNTEEAVKVKEGQTARLPCVVYQLGDKEVTWLRRRDLHILTTGHHTYSADDRFQVAHKPGENEWTLVISFAQVRDSGVYECQVNADPKLSRPVELQVLGPTPPLTVSKSKTFVANNTASTKDGHLRVKIEGPPELFIEEGSTLTLTCLVTSTYGPSTLVYWYHDTRMMDYNSYRGGIKLKIDHQRGETAARLQVAGVGPLDSGMYSCVPAGSHPASVRVHVHQGKQEAAIQQKGLNVTSSGGHLSPPSPLFLLLLFSLPHLLPLFSSTSSTLFSPSSSFLCCLTIFLFSFSYISYFSFISYFIFPVFFLSSLSFYFSLLPSIFLLFYLPSSFLSILFLCLLPFLKQFLSFPSFPLFLSSFPCISSAFFLFQTLLLIFLPSFTSILPFSSKSSPTSPLSSSSLKLALLFFLTLFSSFFLLFALFTLFLFRVIPSLSPLLFLSLDCISSFSCFLFFFFFPFVISKFIAFSPLSVLRYRHFPLFLYSFTFIRLFFFFFLYFKSVYFHGSKSFRFPFVYSSSSSSHSSSSIYCNQSNLPSSPSFSSISSYQPPLSPPQSYFRTIHDLDLVFFSYFLSLPLLLGLPISLPSYLPPSPPPAPFPSLILPLHLSFFISFLFLSSCLILLFFHA